MEEENSSVS